MSATKLLIYTGGAQKNKLCIYHFRELLFAAVAVMAVAVVVTMMSRCTGKIATLCGPYLLVLQTEGESQNTKMMMETVEVGK